MVPPRAQGSVDDVRLFKGISLNDNCIPGCSSPERSMLDEIGLLFENVLEHSTLPGPHPTTHEEEDRTSVAMSHWYHDIRAL
ncbi:hypothetical protein AAHA92_23655 [Salvia divinorum]|uniref:Uncharacterized protein n=1 Tax=Salvia divinorum TaxID=28513 RepID=A0ABD1GVR8_SALDI